MIAFLPDENHIVWESHSLGIHSPQPRNCPSGGTTRLVLDNQERSLTYLQGAALRAVLTAVPSNKSRPNVVVNVYRKSLRLIRFLLINFSYEPIHVRLLERTAIHQD